MANIAYNANKISFENIFFICYNWNSQVNLGLSMLFPKLLFKNTFFVSFPYCVIRKAKVERRIYHFSGYNKNFLWNLNLNIKFNILICIKVVFSGLRYFLATESPLKIMRNAFYFTLKALFVLKIFKFLFWLFGHVGKQLDKKTNVDFKFYGKQLITIHTFPNISSSKR